MTRYGCHGRPAQIESQTLAQDGWQADGTRRMVTIRTQWLPIACGHLTRSTDPLCAGCDHIGRLVDRRKDKAMDLSKLHPKALAAAMKGGTAGWGQVASSDKHVRYAQPVRPTSRRRCHCGCNQRATHIGMANGIALTMACELGIQRWIKTGHVQATKTPNERRGRARGVSDG